MQASHQTSGVSRVLLGGIPILIRPVAASDRAGLVSLFARLGPESRRGRFFTSKVRLSAWELTYFTDVDHVRHEALAAVDGRDGSIVGVARYVQLPTRPGVAEVAFEVADDLQRIGIGLALARSLVRRACESGLAVLTATTLWENRSMRALAHRVGFLARASVGSEIELELYLRRDGPSP
jgi:RimJ/RimL family protein N-acetyltransferase